LLPKLTVNWAFKSLAFTPCTLGLKLVAHQCIPLKLPTSFPFKVKLAYISIAKDLSTLKCPASPAKPAFEKVNRLES